WLKINNWLIWQNIIEITRKKDLKLKLHKVKAYFGNKYNNKQISLLNKQLNYWQLCGHLSNGKHI
ncbi:7375_t:CDS:1, partial [Acaulospora morrowiae]